MTESVISLPGAFVRPLVERFDRSCPPGFLEGAIEMMSDCYRESHAYVGENLAEPEAHDLLGHQRRALIEQGLRTVARRFPELHSEVFVNAAGNYHHTRVEFDGVVLIQCHVQSSGELVRSALFRDTLASTNQMMLFGSAPPVIPGQKLFGILLHGEHERFPDRLAFVDVAFPSPACTEYVERIDLMKRFPDLARRVLPDIAAALAPAAEPTLRPNRERGSTEDK